MKRILWLCSWYPNKHSPLEGNFVKRHAQAASLFNKVHVIKLVPDPEATAIKHYRIKDANYPNLTEEIIYYPKGTGLVAKIKSYKQWLNLYKKAITTYIEKHGKPNLIHVHVPFKSGLPALWAKKKHGVPFVVTEHWGGYNRLVPENYYSRPFWFRSIIRSSLSKAAGIHTVSEFLKKGMATVTELPPVVVLPNVVNTSVFYPAVKRTSSLRFRLLHISNGAWEKNLPLTLDAFKLLDKELFALKVVGLNEEQELLLKEVNPDVEFLGQMTHEAVASEMRASDALVLCSRLENAPCVIAEALTCGIPVIASPVGGIPEMVNEMNGILIAEQSAVPLATAIEEFREIYSRIRHFSIAAVAKERYSYETFAEKLTNWYQEVLTREIKKG